jgi:hypothetical protein
VTCLAEVVGDGLAHGSEPDEAEAEAHARSLAKVEVGGKA